LVSTPSDKERSLVSGSGWACYRTWLTKLFSKGSKFTEVCLVLARIFDLFLDALEYPDGGGEVVYPAGGVECSLDDGDGGDEIVGKAVVEAALELEDVLDLLEELDIAL
jgi:hypothetical protein